MDTKWNGAGLDCTETRGVGNKKMTNKVSITFSYTADNTSFVRAAKEKDNNKINACQVCTQNGMLLTTKETNILIRTRDQSVRAKVLIHKTIDHSLLRTTPIITTLGPVVLEMKGVSILPKKRHRFIQPKICYYAKISRQLYVVQIERGTICMGVGDADKVSQQDPKTCNRCISKGQKKGRKTEQAYKKQNVELVTGRKNLRTCVIHEKRRRIRWAKTAQV